MADAYKTLYQGQLPNSVSTLATVGAAKSWIVKHISIVNTTSGVVTFALYKNGTTDAYRWTPTISVPALGSSEWDGTEAMAAAEYWAGVASAVTSLTCTISGDEVS